MPNTTNFNWVTPADTDLVKDGAAAIRTLGSSIDTSFVDLKGGTTGQVLSKATNTDLDYTWITPNVGDITEVQAGVGISIASGTGPIPVITNSSTDLITTAGDLLYGTAADTVARLGIGTAGQVLKVNSGATAPEWGAASAGSLTKISTTTFSNVATQDIDSVFSSTYDAYYITLLVYAASQADDLHIQFRYSTTTATANYSGALDVLSYLGTSTITGANGAAQMLLSNACGASGFPTTATFNVVMPGGGGSSCRAQLYGEGFNALADEWNQFGYENSSSQIYTGFRIKSRSSNVSGTVVVYGLEK